MVILLLLSFFLAAPLGAANLDVYVIDVEGGKAMLVVAPSGQSMLVDAGWPGQGGRDTDRIIRTIQRAGVKQLDYLVVTHYDTDHVENVPQLLERLPVPVLALVDHGAALFERQQDLDRVQPYLKMRDGGRAKHIVAKPGDSLPMKGIEVKVITSGEQFLRGGVPNPACARVPRPPLERGENPGSVGLLFTYGKFRMIDLADLLKGAEYELMCPNNPVGSVSVFMTDAHGLDLSNSPALVHALRPKVAITNNGARKGGSPEVWKTLTSSPGIEDVWQVHYSMANTKDSNPPEDFVANLTAEGDCQGRELRVSARSDGSFTVTNGRNGFSKTYR